MLDPEPAVLDAAEFLATYREGVLFADSVPLPRRFVSDPGSGRLLMPVPPEIAAAVEHVLHIPEESDDAMSLIIGVAPTDPDELPACDRYLAYHGPADEARWIACTIDAAKWGGVVLDGPLLQKPNPLADAEGRLCKLANADQARLAAAMSAHRNLDIPAPLCVGVDPGGLHVRARFGVVRVRFPRPAAAEADAAEAIRQFLS
jgi:hypothetical protein